jgi:hypothetical protein
MDAVGVVTSKARLSRTQKSYQSRRSSISVEAIVKIEPQNVLITKTSRLNMIYRLFSQPRDR